MMDDTGNMQVQEKKRPRRRVSGHNENPRLELPGALELPCSSSASGGPEACKSGCVLSV